MKRFKKALFMMAAIMTVIALTVVSTSACSMIYAGSALTEDGAAYVARSEDYQNDRSKILLISEAGHYKEGEEYVACTQGDYVHFTYTWTHDSYEFTTFSEDYLLGTCPECGEEIQHLAFSEHGTNEKGVSVSATETIGGNGLVTEVDPYPETGIEESEIPMLILAEAATAREGIELLMSIYDTAGCLYANGLTISDQNEIWYIENCSGTQYLAVKLSPDLVFVEPNMAVLGVIDLDDTENVLASERLIEVAKEAGTFVGNEEENIIDFRASYSEQSIGQRIIDGINFLNAEYSYTAENITAEDFTVSNVKDGEIVELYSNIEVDRVLTIDDIVNFYKLDSVGRASNIDTTIYQIWSEGDMETSTVEWIAMDDLKYNVFIPYYPMLTTEFYEAYQYGVGLSEFVTEEPEASDFEGHPGTKRMWTAEGPVSIDGYILYPEGWKNNFAMIFNGVANYLRNIDNSKEADVLGCYKAMQEDVYATYAEMQEKVKTVEDPSEYATQTQMEMAEKVYKLAVALYDYLTGTDKLVFTSDMDYGDIEFPVATLSVADVAQNDWFADAALYGVKNGFILGMSNDGTAMTFAPSVKLTRAMFATLLYRMAGAPDVSELDNPFADVEEDKWYSDAIKWAYDSKVVYGIGEDTFAPNATITREQIALMLYRYLKDYMKAEPIEGADLAGFPDGASVHEYAAEAMQWVYAAGLITGTTSEDGVILDPLGDVTRAQCATILMRFSENI